MTNQNSTDKLSSMNVKLLSGALGAEIEGIDLTDISDQNFKKINDLLLEHKVIFFRDQPITNEQQIAPMSNKQIKL